MKLLPTIKKATIDEIIPIEVAIYDLSSTNCEITTIQKNSVIIKSIPNKVIENTSHCTTKYPSKI